MKLYLLIFALFLLQLQAVEEEVETILNDWEQSLTEVELTPQTLGKLEASFKTEIPNPEKRIEKVHQWFTSLSEVSSDDYMGKIFSIMGVWNQLAEPKIRAEFISKVFNQKENSENSGIIFFYAKRGGELFDINKYEKASEEDFSNHIKTERLYTTQAYTGKEIVHSNQLAGFLFTKAPASALLDYSGFKNNQEVASLVKQVEDLRLELYEKSNLSSWDKPQALLIWNELQSTLEKLSQYAEPAIDAYLARIVKSIKGNIGIFPISPQVLNVLKERESELTAYLMSSDKAEDLFAIDNDAPLIINPSDKINKQALATNTPQVNQPKQTTQQTKPQAEIAAETKPSEKQTPTWLIYALTALGLIVLSLVVKKLRNKA